MESSVSALMEHLNTVETRRRVVMMRRKEAETRLAFSAEESLQLDRQLAADAAREVELKRELDHLLAAQRAAQLQHVAAADALRRGAVEDALLADHARAQTARAAADGAAWRQHAADLRAADKRRADRTAADLLRRRDEAAAAAVRLRSEKARLERDAAGGAEVPAPSAGGEWRERVDGARRAWDERRATHSRQTAALEREMADLAERAAELRQWMQHTTDAHDTARRQTEAVGMCVARGQCADCCAAKSET